MRRTIIALISVVLVATVTAAAAEAGRKKRYKRQVQASYVGGPLSPNAAIVDGNTCFPANVGCVYFDTNDRDAYVKITIEDDHGDVVAATLFQEGVDAPVAQICESTRGFVPIEPGRQIQVSVQEGECNGELAVATSGAVVATFADRP